METEKPDPVVVPKERISAESLEELIGEFILREGTDYGAQEATYEAKVRQIYRQLDAGDICIVYDAAEETVSIVPKRALPAN